MKLAVIAVTAALLSSGCSAPGERIAFVPLSQMKQPPRPIELTPGAGGRMLEELERGGARNIEQARTALSWVPAKDKRGYAFVLAGCRDTGAELVVGERLVSAELTGGENVNCGVAEYFLAVFEVAAEDVPEHARVAP